MPSYTFPTKTSFLLTWSLTDGNGAPIINASVTANLYADRSLMNPDLMPGTTVSPIVNFILNPVDGQPGVYSAAVPATLDPPDATSFVLVIDATVSGTAVYHSENPVVIEPSAGSPLDLTTVQIVKDWMPNGNASNSDDGVIQECITAWGWEFLRRTGMGDQSGEYTQSPFNNVCTWNEVYDGAGTRRLFVRNRPVKSVISLSINGTPIAASTGYPVQGYVIDASRRSISLLSGTAGWGPMLYSAWQAGPFHAFGGGIRFQRALQNIAISYTAGYTRTPTDIVECANKVVHQNYKRRPYTDEETRSMAGGGGSTRFRSWDIPPDCQRVVDQYTRSF
jgi:hypothetical protein